MSVSISECLTHAVEQLRGVSDSARIDAEVILAYVLDKDRAYLFTWPERELGPEQFLRWQECLTRRAAGEPVAYILGEKEFWSLALFTDDSTLIPRSDTELLVEQALMLLPDKPARILDLGTGTGAIALALAKERSDCSVDAVDNSHGALSLVDKNIKRHRLSNVRAYYSDWFSDVDACYDLVVSNPPYIDAQDSHLNQGDVKHEPSSALVSSEGGLADLAHIVSRSRTFLKHGAVLLVEHGWKQKEAVQSLFLNEGYESVNTVQDYSGNDRATHGYFR